MEPHKKTARIAGFLYLIVVTSSIFYMEYVPGKIFVRDDAMATMGNLVNHQTLFRTGIAVSILGQIAFLLLPLALYRLIGHINKNAAAIMVIFVLISVPISHTLLLEKYELLDLLQKYIDQTHADRDSIASKVLDTYQRYYNGFFISEVFWGLWLFPFGFLVFKSGFLPKVLGIFLMLGCITYLIDVFGGTLFPNYYDYVNTMVLIIPAAIGEIGICLWLLTIGTRQNIKF